MKPGKSIADGIDSRVTEHLRLSHIFNTTPIAKESPLFWRFESKMRMPGPVRSFVRQSFVLRQFMLGGWASEIGVSIERELPRDLV